MVQEMACYLEDLEMVARGGRVPSRGLLRKLWHERGREGGVVFKEKIVCTVQTLGKSVILGVRRGL